MKIIYSISAIYNAGGMEHILQQKANYLADVVGYEVVIVTTEQLGKSPFFHFSDKIRLIDLNVNYGDREEKKGRSHAMKAIWKNLHKPIHKKRMKKILMEERPDYVITLFNKDIGFLPSIKDGSKKIAEFHFSYNYKMIEARSSVVRFVQGIRMKVWKRQLSKFDHFVVLTEEDKTLWGNMPNITVIPNFIFKMPEGKSALTEKRVIAVGRLDYQKGFDMLLMAWKECYQLFPEWKLDIFGNGDESDLKTLIYIHGIKGAEVHPATKNIGLEYINSSLFVLSSRFEGLPMVLLEAMSYGLPVVAFKCECGPKDIIRNTFGTLVEKNDVSGLANAMIQWMGDENLIREGGKNSLKEIEKYTADKIMKKWVIFLERK